MARSGANPAVFLLEQLPLVWRDAYLRAVAHDTNLVRFRFRTFEYICDLYSQLEATGEPFPVEISSRLEDDYEAVLSLLR